MKKGVVASKSASTSACAMKIRTSDFSGQLKSKALSPAVNRKTRSSQELDSSKSNMPPRAIRKSAKSSLERKPSLSDSLSKYNVEDMTPRELHKSLSRIKENPVEPFAFLSNIFDERTSDIHVSIERTKPTEIDLQLAALKRRVELNKSLLERTNEHVKEINFLTERNSMIASRELNYDENVFERRTASGDGVDDSDSALKASCPGIVELQRTIKATKDMLGYVRKICNEEMKTSNLSKQSADHTSLDTETKNTN